MWTRTRFTFDYSLFVTCDEIVGILEQTFTKTNYSLEKLKPQKKSPKKKLKLHCHIRIENKEKDWKSFDKAANCRSQKLSSRSWWTCKTLRDFTKHVCLEVRNFYN